MSTLRTSLRPLLADVPAQRPLRRRVAWRLTFTLLAIGLLVGALPASAVATTEPARTGNAGWQVVGRQGIVRIVIVPVQDAADPAAYAREIEQLCEEGQTCFLNFYTNSRNAPLSVPLPEAISSEAVAMFRRSMKAGAEMMQYACSLKIPNAKCF